MLKKAFELAIQLITLLRDVRETREKVALIQEEMDRINETLRDLTHQFQLLSQREQSEREKLTLQLENALLRAEKLLPSSKSKRLVANSFESAAMQPRSHSPSISR
jgi:hypothetical protein